MLGSRVAAVRDSLLLQPMPDRPLTILHLTPIRTTR